MIVCGVMDCVFVMDVLFVFVWFDFNVVVCVVCVEV